MKRTEPGRLASAGDRATQATPRAPTGLGHTVSVTDAVSGHARALELSVIDALTDDATSIIQRVPFIERYPARLWSLGLVSELAEASDRLAVAVSKLQEAQGADR